MAYYPLKNEPFRNKLGQVIKPNTNIYVGVSTNGITVREGIYLGLDGRIPLVIVHYTDDRGNYMVKTFRVKSGNIYLRVAG